MSYIAILGTYLVYILSVLSLIGFLILIHEFKLLYVLCSS